MTEVFMLMAGLAGSAGAGVFLGLFTGQSKAARMLSRALHVNDPRRKIEQVLLESPEIGSAIRTSRFGDDLVRGLGRLHGEAKTPKETRKVDDKFIQELVTLCDTDPEKALRIINGLPADVQSRPIILMCRLVAHCRIILGPSDREEQIAAKFSEFIDRLDSKRRQLAINSLPIIRAVEQADAGLIVSSQFSSVVDVVCLVAEWVAAGSVQGVLGWTKIGYFPPDRVLVLKEPAELIEQLPYVPEHVIETMAAVRISPPVKFRLAVAISARTSSSGHWTVLFALFSATKVPMNGRLADAGLQGFLTVGDEGTWRFDRP